MHGKTEQFSKVVTFLPQTNHLQLNKDIVR